MAKMINCPMCATIKAFNQELMRVKGVYQSYDPRSCNSCGGSGRVPEVPKSYRKRRKDLSGTEWTEREQEDEWNHYITFERSID